MLTIRLVKSEYFNDETQEFIESDYIDVRMEHSLVSLSKWESKWEKPFLGPNDKTAEETLDYIRCMTLDELDPSDYDYLSQKNIQEINDYINSKQSATVINEFSSKKQTNSEITTSELIYYWMVAHNIPMECQHWHLNRLLTLIRICNIKNTPDNDKKMSKREILERNRALNAERRAKYKTKG